MVTFDNQKSFRKSSASGGADHSITNHNQQHLPAKMAAAAHQQSVPAVCSFKASCDARSPCVLSWGNLQQPQATAAAASTSVLMDLDMNSSCSEEFNCLMPTQKAANVCSQSDSCISDGCFSNSCCRSQ